MSWKQRPILMAWAALTVALVAAGCSPATTTIAESGTGSDAHVAADTVETVTALPAGALEGPDLEARGMAIVDEAPAALAPAFSSIEQVGDLGFYYVAAQGEMALVAFDAATLMPRYQVPASPLGRLRGVGQEVLVDDDLGLVFVTGYDDDVGGEDAGYLAAHHAATGEEQWRTSIDFFANQPFDCGPAVCVRTNGEQRQIDKATGSLLQFARVSDRRVLYTSADLTVTTLASVLSGEFAGVAGSASFGLENDWELTADNIASATGHVVDPSFGWRADYFPTDNVVIVYLAPVEADGWTTLGVDSRTGNILWSRPGMTPCVDSPAKELPPVVCLTGDDPYLVAAVERINPRSGDAEWSTELAAEGAELVYDGTTLVAWWFGEFDGGNAKIDLATGELSGGPQTALCQLSNPWQEFETPDGESYEWSSGDLFSVCLDDGFLLYADEILDAKPTLDLGASGPIWLVDFDGIPLTTAG